ncbi:uncharacterized protein METZ01_LOCUS438255, partial [marine metagenome]
AGYPDIDVATRPFDWPLTDGATKAMKVSRMLDNVIGMHKGTSLRSSLLNRDLNYRLTKDSGGDESPERKQKVLLEAHLDCLMLLFARTRRLDGHPLDRKETEDSDKESEEESGGEGEVPNYLAFRPQEEALLGALHSYDNNRRGKWWPNIAEKQKSKKGVRWKSKFTAANKGFSKIIGTAVEVSETYDKEKNLETLKEWQEKKRKSAQQKVGERFSLPNEQGLRPISFQFHYVQSWLKNNFPDGAGLDGTAQRFLRGFSIML